jgi:tellurite methyltransferase
MSQLITSRSIGSRAMERARGGEATRRLWNERHAAAIFSDEPVPWLAEQRDVLALQLPGRALDVACGGGRNAFFLAELGFEVDALDISDVAVDRVRSIAAARGAPVTAHRVDLANGAAFPRVPYDVVIDFFYLERPLFDAIASALAPRGLLVFQTFLGGRRVGPDFGLEPDELRHAFTGLGLEIVHYDEVEIGDDRSGRRKVARLTARRKG